MNICATQPFYSGYCEWIRFSLSLFHSLWFFLTPVLSAGFSLEFKSSQIARTLLSILADFKNAFSYSLRDYSKGINNDWLSQSLSRAFSALWQDIGIYLSIYFLLLSLWSAETTKSSDRAWLISENVTHLIFLDRFWFVHILFVSMVKFESLALFPVDHLSHPVMPSLVFLFWQFAKFLHNVINRFIFVTK